MRIPSFPSAVLCPVVALASLSLSLFLASCSSVGLSAGSGGLGVSAAHGPAPEYVVRGTVTYLERVTTAPDAVVKVQVTDVSQKDLAAEILGGVEFSPDGKQPPYTFEIQIPKRAVKRDATIVVQARIEDADGTLRFITDTQYPVITGGSPKEVDLVLVAVSPNVE